MYGKSTVFNVTLLSVLAVQTLLGGDWTDWRGPLRNGTSPEKNLPEEWSPGDENLAWKAPYGGRSAPIVMGNRVFVFNSIGEGETLQERVMALDADSGKVLWKYQFNVYSSDVPPHRAAWSAPAGDPETGNVYVFGVGGTLLGLSNDGKVLWERPLAEEMGLVTTHGGRTVSPVIDGDLVIVSGVSSGWGNQSRASHRFMAFDKKTGKTVWVSTPGGRPYDTTYSPPLIADVNGTRLLMAGGGDGAVHAIKAATGEPVWSYEVSKRGINTGVALNGTTAIISHSEENLEGSEMGLRAAIDATHQGKIGPEQIKWSFKGFQGGLSSPIVDGDRIYQIDNGAKLYAFDVTTGKALWDLPLGTIQKASPVLADGKLYVGTENGKFFIIRPGQEKAEILDEDELLGPDQRPEAIIASPAVSNGRIYLVSTQNIYAIGKKTGNPSSNTAGKSEPPAASTDPVAHVQVRPTELILKPGEKVKLHARLYDAKGRFIREEKGAEWSLEGLPGSVAADGTYSSPAGDAPGSGMVKATVNGISGASRIRVIPPLPWSVDLESIEGDKVPGHWINATGKFTIRELDGNKVLVKLSENPATRRARVYMGHPDTSNYTVEVDAKAIEKRRQMGDAGVVAQRYSLILFGNHQRMELQSWQPETNRSVVKPFPWKSDTWYRIKLRVEPTTDGKVKAMGKAWPAGETEPAEWTVQRVDPIPNRHGSPGIYADAPSEVMFDNLKVAANQ